MPGRCVHGRYVTSGLVRGSLAVATLARLPSALGLLVTLEIVDVARFLMVNPSAIPHIVTMSICSAIGQLFIFYTIKHFGPLVFATIQTVRQVSPVAKSQFYQGLRESHD